MTPGHLSERAVSGCPCGRSHPDPRGFRFVPRRPEDNLGYKVYRALLDGRVDNKGDYHEVDYARDCSSPVSVAANDGRTIFVRRRVRCRRCKACLRARTNYWGFAAQRQTEEAQAAGLRTWFGTLTLSPDAQAEMLGRARALSPESGNADWWDDPSCDERFRLVRDVLLAEMQKYWKRLRKAGHRFKYFLVFERHKSGLPHMHWLLHEAEDPITKRAIQAQWPWGHSNVSIVGGRSKNAAAPNKAAWYVVKYLSKSVQARQIASHKYRPRVRA